MELCIGKFKREIKQEYSLATALEFSLVWADSVDDSSQLVRINAAAIGVALDSTNMLPAYRPNRDKILVYGRKILERLLEKNVPLDDIYREGTKILSAMSAKLPQQGAIDEQKDFFPSADQET